MNVGCKIFKAIILLCLVSVSINSEYLIYKVDKSQHSSIASIDYVGMSDAQRKQMRDLYRHTVYRYQFPTFKLFYQSFSDQERQEYQAALKQDFGLFNFIKNSVEKESRGVYSLVWVPTTVFEMFALYIFLAAAGLQLPSADINYCPNIVNDFRKKAEQWLGGKSVVQNLLNDKVGNLENNDLMLDNQILLYFVTSDYVLQHYRNGDVFVKAVSASNIERITTMLKGIGKELKQPDDGISPVYKDAFLPIIERCLPFEQKAYEKNQFLLMRGTDGFKDRVDLVRNKRDLSVDFDRSYFDLRDISYAYSLFAGTLFDRTMMAPARTLEFMLARKVGYVLLVNIADLFLSDTIFSISLPYYGKDRSIFSLPFLTSIQGLFGWGEKFHPRLNEQVALAQNYRQVIGSWLPYLSRAHIVKSASDVNGVQILHEEIEMQKQELLNSALQGSDAVIVREDQEYEKIRQQMKQERDALIAREKAKPKAVYDQVDKNRIATEALDLARLLR